MENRAQRTGAGWTDREIKGKKESSGKMRVTGRDEAGKKMSRESWLNKREEGGQKTGGGGRISMRGADRQQNNRAEKVRL